MYFVKRISFSDAKDFILDKTLIVKDKPNIFYYGLFDEQQMVSVLSLEEGANRIKVRSNYTPTEFRKRGYFTALLSSVLHKYSKKMNIMNIYADCTDYSKRIYERLGFKEKSFKHCKNFNITRMELEYGKTKN